MSDLLRRVAAIAAVTLLPFAVSWALILLPVHSSNYWVTALILSGAFALGGYLAARAAHREARVIVVVSLAVTWIPVALFLLIRDHLARNAAVLVADCLLASGIAWATARASHYELGKAEQGRRG